MGAAPDSQHHIRQTFASTSTHSTYTGESPSYASSLPSTCGRTDEQELIYQEPWPPLVWEVPLEGPAKGLLNLGNSCFMNSVLQAVTHLPPVWHLGSGLYHKRSCDAKFGDCAMCLLEYHIHGCRRRSADGTMGPIAPRHFFSRLKTLFSRSLTPGQQEDAHEWLLALLEGCERSCARGLPKLRPGHSHVTLINRLFQGSLVGLVRCHSCGTVTRTPDHFMCLSLDLPPNVRTVDKAIERFTALEELRGDNLYQCDVCRKLVPASRCSRLTQLPPCLVLHLKRFTPWGTKIQRDIAFGPRLDVSPYIGLPLEFQPSSTAGPISGHGAAERQYPNGHNHTHSCAGKHAARAPASGAVDPRGDEPYPPGPPHAGWYQLWGVVVHEGGSAHSGHYFAFVRTVQQRAGGHVSATWYEMNDSYVQQVRYKDVHKHQAYMLLYVLAKPRGPTVQTATGNVVQPESARSPPLSHGDTLGTRDPDISGSGPQQSGSTAQESVPGFIGPQLPKQQPQGSCAGQPTADAGHSLVPPAASIGPRLPVSLDVPASSPARSSAESLSNAAAATSEPSTAGRVGCQGGAPSAPSSADDRGSRVDAMGAAHSAQPKRKRVVADCSPLADKGGQHSAIADPSTSEHCKQRRVGACKSPGGYGALPAWGVAQQGGADDAVTAVTAEQQQRVSQQENCQDMEADLQHQPGSARSKQADIVCNGSGALISVEGVAEGAGRSAAEHSAGGVACSAAAGAVEGTAGSLQAGGAGGGARSAAEPAGSCAINPADGLQQQQSPLEFKTLSVLSASSWSQLAGQRLRAFAQRALLLPAGPKAGAGDDSIVHVCAATPEQFVKAAREELLLDLRKAVPLAVKRFVVEQVQQHLQKRL